MTFKQKDRYTMQDLLDIVALLRDPDGGCPWDKVQTHESIRTNLLEETYEAADAIDLQDAHLLCEELGDVLLQIALHTQMEAETGVFTFEDVTTGICQKLILRHPHIFGNVQASTADEVLQNWAEIKRAEKHREDAAHDLDSVPRALPALMRARKVQKRAQDHGFPYMDADAALRDLESEIAELRAAIAQDKPAEIDEELGDVLFSAVNVSRCVKAEPEEALTRATDKFTRRVKRVEALCAEEGISANDLSAEKLDTLWKQAKGFCKAADQPI